MLEPVILSLQFRDTGNQGIALPQRINDGMRVVLNRPIQHGIKFAGKAARAIAADPHAQDR